MLFQDCLKPEEKYIRCFDVPLISTLRIDSQYLKYQLRHLEETQKIPIDKLKIVSYDEMEDTNEHTNVKRSFYQRNEGHIGTLINTNGIRRAKLVNPQFSIFFDQDDQEQDDDHDDDDDDDDFNQEEVVKWLNKLVDKNQLKSTKKKNNKKVKQSINGIFNTSTTIPTTELYTKPISQSSTNQNKPWSTQPITESFTKSTTQSYTKPMTPQWSTNRLLTVISKTTKLPLTQVNASTQNKNNFIPSITTKIMTSVNSGVHLIPTTNLKRNRPTTFKPKAITLRYTTNYRPNKFIVGSFVPKYSNNPLQPSSPRKFVKICLK